MSTEEASLNFDLNGDGFRPGPTTLNGVNLGSNPLGYALQVDGAAPLQVSFFGTIASPSNPGDGWIAVAATPVEGGYSFFWRHSVGGQVVRWLLNSSATYLSGALLTPSQVSTEEASLNFDLNGDGFRPGTTTLATIESQGLTSFLRRSDGVAFVQSGSAAPLQVTSPWNTPAGDDTTQWQLLAAESIDGTNKILWRNNVGNYLHTWALNSSWGWQASEGSFPLSSPGAWNLESAFQVDANRDGIIGAPLTTVESQGLTSFLRRSDGVAFVQSGSAAPLQVTSPWNTPAGDDTTQWQLLAAESIDGTNKILWRNNVGNYLHTWALNSSWGWQASEGSFPLSSPGAWNLESAFQVDANRDGIIGIP